MLLIISKNKKDAERVRETFYYMSILSYAATPSEALSEVSSLYRAVLVLHPTALADYKDFVKRLRSYDAALPIFAFCDEEADGALCESFDAVFLRSTFSALLAEKIIAYAREHSLMRIGEYTLAGFDASSDRVGVSYFDRRLGLTKTEAMILRYLIRSYPRPACAKDILKYAFKSTRAPETSSIRTHISIMNKKLTPIIEKRAILLVEHEGYLISMPEYAYKGKLL